MNPGSTGSLALYSVLLGGYERLNEQPEIADTVGDLPRFLLTDDPTITSDFWQVVAVDPALPADLVRSQRLLKILGHPVLEPFDRTLYVDNAVRLRSHPVDIVDAWLGEHDLAAPSHSYRERVLDEFDEVLRLQYDDPARLYEQVLHYGRTNPTVLERRPHWTAILARRSNDEVRRAMRRWADHVLRYSRRDQLSFESAIEGLDVATIAIDNMGSDHHAWPVDLSRRVEQGKAFDPPPGPLVAEIARRERRIEELVVALREKERLLDTRAELVAERDAAIAAREQAERDLAAQAKDRQRERAAAQEHTADQLVAQQQTFERSLSWRVTTPLRYLRSRLRR